MAIDQLQIMQSIYDIINDSLSLTPPRAGARPSSPSTWLSLSVPGIPVYEPDYADAWSMETPNGNMATAESLAWLIDALPALSPIYTPSGQSLDVLYGQIVSANVMAPAAGGPAPTPGPTPRTSPARSPAHPTIVDAGVTRVSPNALRIDADITHAALALRTPQGQKAFSLLHSSAPL